MPYKDKEKAKAWRKDWRHDHHEQLLGPARAARRRWNERHPDYYKQWREANPNYFREYRQKNPDYAPLHRSRRRVKEIGASGRHSIQEWREKLALLGNCCIYCGESRLLTKDHNIPLARGGTDNISNILPACRSCNAQKRNKTAREFLRLDSVT